VEWEYSFKEKHSFGGEEYRFSEGLKIRVVPRWKFGPVVGREVLHGPLENEGSQLERRKHKIGRYNESQGMDAGMHIIPDMCE
jgi:hypothetical protein